MPSHYLAHGLRKLKPQVQKATEGNKLGSLRLDLDCSAIEAAAAAAEFVINHYVKSDIICCVHTKICMCRSFLFRSSHQY
jgi:hypothetical protein